MTTLQLTQQHSFFIDLQSDEVGQRRPYRSEFIRRPFNIKPSAQPSLDGLVKRTVKSALMPGLTFTLLRPLHVYQFRCRGRRDERVCSGAVCDDAEQHSEDDGCCYCLFAGHACVKDDDSKHDAGESSRTEPPR